MQAEPNGTGAASKAPMTATTRSAGRRAWRPGVPRWLSLLLSDGKATVGLGILAFFLVVVILAPFIWTGDPMATDKSFIDRGMGVLNPPSANHWFGTDVANRDIFLQVINGGRQTLFLGFSVGVIATILSVLVGVSAGFFGGMVDEVLSTITNVFLVLPPLPVCIVIASYITVKSEWPIIGVISFIAWAWSARVYRSQAMSIRSKDFVEAAIVSGESGFKIVWSEILPNMISIVVSGFIGVTTFAILFSVALDFLGFANNAPMSWGRILFFAQTSGAVQAGRWWTYVFAGMAVTLVSLGLILINFGVDVISNPRLRVEELKTQPRPRMTPSPDGVNVARAR